jgi:ABC-2 type transport system permease protein
LSFAAYLAPGFAYFYLHVLALLLAFSALWPRVPGRPAAVTAGRLTAVWLATLALGVATTWSVLPRVGILPASAPHVVVTVLALFLAADMLFAAALAAIGRQGLFPLQMAVLLGMLSLMLSGMTWPWDAIPAPLRAVASAIPFTPFAAASRRLLLEPVGLADLARPLGWLGLQVVCFLAVLAAARLVRRFGPALRRAT